MIAVLFLIAGAAHADAPAPVERQVTFAGVGGVKLAGTLTLPANAKGKKWRAIVLIAGSGPVDRDGNSGAAFHTDLLKHIAQALAADGVASLRYDKRGVGGSLMPTEALMSQSALGNYAAWENFVGDAEGAFRFLQQEPEIDPARVGFLGHSEGSWLALQAADELKNAPNPPAVLVLVSTSGRPIDQIIHDQLVALLKRQGATPEQTKFFLDENARITEAVRKSGVIPPDVPPGLAALYPAYLGKFYKSELAMDPAKLAAAYPGPVLVLQGEKDTQLPPAANLPPLEAALESRHPDIHSVILIAGASHNMKIVSGPDDPGFAGPVAPQALHALTGWLATHRFGSAGMSRKQH